MTQEHKKGESWQIEFDDLFPFKNNIALNNLFVDVKSYILNLLVEEREQVRHQAQEELKEALREEIIEQYLEHRIDCKRFGFSAGEPTEDGGYREKFDGVWYQARPVDETPKCDCGLTEVLKFLE